MPSSSPKALREGLVGEIESEPVLRLLRRLVIAEKAASGGGTAGPEGNTKTIPPSPNTGLPRAPPNTPCLPSNTPPPTPQSPHEVAAQVTTSVSPAIASHSPRSVPTHDIMRVVESCGDRQATAKVAGLLKLRSHLRGRVAQMKREPDEQSANALVELQEDIEKTEREVRSVLKDLAKRMSSSPSPSPSKQQPQQQPTSGSGHGQPASLTSPYTPFPSAPFSSPQPKAPRTHPESGGNGQGDEQLTGKEGLKQLLRGWPAE